MKIVLFDDNTWNNLLPLTFTRPVAEIRIGILTIAEKWEILNGKKVNYLSQDYLKKKFSIASSLRGDTVFINSKIIPDKDFLAQVKKLKPGSGLKQQNTLLAFNGGAGKFQQDAFLKQSVSYSKAIFSINTLTDIFTKNGEALKQDFEWLTKGKKSQQLSKTNVVIGNKNLIFLEKGAKAEASVFNTEAGPIYIGKKAEVMEGCVVRGPFSLGEESVLKMSAKIYGPTTIGPHSKVGGEVNNSVIFGYSNKAHDGFLGNSIVGEWCNLGADTNNSNLKNNYGNIKLYSYANNRNEDTGLQFCGLIMADHSKTGINTMFNTGTVVGVGANVFGAGFPPTHIPSFSWGAAQGFETYRLEKMLETTEKVFGRRKLKLSPEDKAILKHIYNDTCTHRHWD